MSEETPKPKRKISLNENDMTLGDMEEFEDITGMSFSDAIKRVKVIDPETGMQMTDPDPAAKGAGLWENVMSMKGLVAMLYLTLRKEEPSITLADVRKMNFGEFEMEAPKKSPKEETETQE